MIPYLSSIEAVQLCCVKSSIISHCG